MPVLHLQGVLTVHLDQLRHTVSQIPDNYQHFTSIFQNSGKNFVSKSLYTERAAYDSVWNRELTTSCCIELGCNRIIPVANSVEVESKTMVATGAMCTAFHVRTHLFSRQFHCFSSRARLPVTRTYGKARQRKARSAISFSIHIQTT